MMWNRHWGSRPTMTVESRLSIGRTSLTIDITLLTVSLVAFTGLVTASLTAETACLGRPPANPKTFRSSLATPPASRLASLICWPSGAGGTSAWVGAAASRDMSMIPSASWSPPIPSVMEW